MSDFLHGPDLSRAIRTVLGEPAARAAVAFWGKGSQDWVTGPGVRVLANLMMGGTNPYALEKVPAQVRQNGALHAKVYIGAKQTVVCSANASINGLALEGPTQAGWIEAGLLCQTTEKIVDWFECLWDSPGAEITKTQWKEAKRLWNLRRSSFLPTLASFGQFDVDAADLPAFTWVSDEADWKVDENALAATGLFGKDAERRVNGGLWIRHPSDAEHLKNRWVLVVTKRKDGGIGRKPWFVQMSEVFVPGGFRWSDGAPQDILLSADRDYPRPFDQRNPRFLAALQAVLARKEFARLLDDDSAGQSWYSARHELTRRLWRDVRAEYDAVASGALGAD
jgi:hypothetical protein